MAKKNNQPTPVIKPTSSILAWLNNSGNGETTEVSANNTQEGRGEATPKDPQPEDVETITPSQEVNSSIEEKSLNTAEEPQLVTPENPQEEIKEIPEQSKQAVQASKATGNQRKKSGQGKSYADLFFTKPPKAEGEPESKTIVRISEESHWFIGVLLESAKKQGVTLSISDLIDNLVKDHREKYQVEVDEFITQWKVRKRIG